MAIETWYTFGSGNRLLADGIKPLPETKLSWLTSVRSCGLYPSALPWEDTNQLNKIENDVFKSASRAPRIHRVQNK